MPRHDLKELYQWQSLPLNEKILMTKRRITEWVEKYGEDGVYVSFSGGKDSTVLLTIARELYPNIKAVFVNTSLEYPEIIKFVKTFDNVEIIKPKLTFRQVIEKYGYPYISKEISECVYGAKKYLTTLIEKIGDEQTDNQKNIPYSYFFRKLTGLGEYEKPNIDNNGVQEGEYDSESLHKLLDTNELKELVYSRPKGEGQRLRLARMLGMLDRQTQIKVNIEKKDRSSFNLTKWKFLLEAPFDISNQCCNVMKKSPAHSYQRKTGRKPITAQMASESKLRTQQWMKNGCNGFEMKKPISNPMAFWTEQDVLLYIKVFNIKIASVYGDVVFEDGKEINIDGMDLLEEFDLDRHLLTTTGCQRTGCVACGYGCHLEKGVGRFELLKQTHPKLYDYIMRPDHTKKVVVDPKTGEEKIIDVRGLNYKENIDWLNEHGNLNIKY